MIEMYREPKKVENPSFQGDGGNLRCAFRRVESKPPGHVWCTWCSLHVKISFSTEKIVMIGKIPRSSASGVGKWYLAADTPTTSNDSHQAY